MGLYGKHWFINVKLMTFAFAGQIFQFVARQNDAFENLVLGPLEENKVVPLIFKQL